MSFGTTCRRLNPHKTMCLEGNLAYAHWAALTTIKAAMHTRFASVAIRS
jgi:hypothetical protein